MRPLPKLPPPQIPNYAPLYAARPTLREHIFTVRQFSQVKLPEATMSGTVPLAAVSTPRLAHERGVKPPRTPVYDESVYDDSWNTSVVGYFGPPH